MTITHPTPQAAAMRAIRQDGARVGFAIARAARAEGITAGELARRMQARAVEARRVRVDVQAAWWNG
jgi:hypothetical protein